MSAVQSTSQGSAGKRLGLFAVLALVLAILIYKGINSGWFLPRSPLELNEQPAVIFFNREKGCECALIVYQAASRQMHHWPEAQRSGVQLVEVNLDQRPDLGEHYQIRRAPTVLLVDARGRTVYKQDEMVSDLEPINLRLLEQEIQEVIDGN